MEEYKFHSQITKKWQLIFFVVILTGLGVFFFVSNGFWLGVICIAGAVALLFLCKVEGRISDDTIAYYSIFGIPLQKIYLKDVKTVAVFNHGVLYNQASYRRNYAIEGFGMLCIVISSADIPISETDERTAVTYFSLKKDRIEIPFTTLKEFEELEKNLPFAIADPYNHVVHLRINEENKQRKV